MSQSSYIFLGLLPRLSVKSFVELIHFKPADPGPLSLTRPLSEPHTGTTWPKTSQLLRSLIYSTGNAQVFLVPSLPLLLRQREKQTYTQAASEYSLLVNASLSLYMT